MRRPWFRYRKIGGPIVRLIVWWWPCSWQGWLSTVGLFVLWVGGGNAITILMFPQHVEAGWTAIAVLFLTSFALFQVAMRYTGDDILRKDWDRESNSLRDRNRGEGEGEVSGDLLTGTIEEIAEKARGILRAICPEAWCQEQEWDNRIDFGVEQPDGKVVSEWIVLREITEKRVRECGERLRLRQKGIPVDLENEIPPPIYIGGGRGRLAN